jgi:hypothetical protein
MVIGIGREGRRSPNPDPGRHKVERVDRRHASLTSGSNCQREERQRTGKEGAPNGETPRYSPE